MYCQGRVSALVMFTHLVKDEPHYLTREILIVKLDSSWGAG